MKFSELIFIILNLSNTLARRRHKIMSSESVENIIYYKDCSHKQKPTAMPLRSVVQPPQQCRMLCTMCCGDQCVNSGQMDTVRQNQVLESKVMPISPNVQKEKRKVRPRLQPPIPIPERRRLSFTRDNIKSLISRDEDIRKILKDLVRVTMQKVDLMELIKNRNFVKTNPESNESDSDNIS